MMHRMPCDGCKKERSIRTSENIAAPYKKAILTADFFFVTLERVDVLHGSDIIKLDDLVARSCCYEIAVWTPRAILDRVLVAVADKGCISDKLEILFACTAASTHNVARTVLDRGSQNLTRLSLLPETIRPLVGCQSTHLTSQP